MHFLFLVRCDKVKERIKTGGEDHVRRKNKEKSERLSNSENDNGAVSSGKQRGYA